MGPFKCPDCGIWWAGFEHRCRPTTTTTGTVITGFTVSCTCTYVNGIRQPTTLLCSLHDIYDYSYFTNV